MKTIEITPPGFIPPDKQEQYNDLKALYTQLTEKQNRTDEERAEMEELVRKAQEFYSSTSSE